MCIYALDPDLAASWVQRESQSRVTLADKRPSRYCDAVILLSGFLSSCRRRLNDKADLQRIRPVGQRFASVPPGTKTRDLSRLAMGPSTTTLCAVFFVILLWPENMGFQPCFHCPGGHQSAPPSGVIKPAVSEPRNVVVLGGIEEILARGSPALISPGV